MLFLDSLGFFTSVALGFAPKDPLGLDFKAKQNLKKNLKTCLSRARCLCFLFAGVVFCFLTFIIVLNMSKIVNLARLRQVFKFFFLIFSFSRFLGILRIFPEKIADI